MTTTPEHQKVEDLKAKNQLAGNLAHLLLDSDNWTLSNHRSDPAIDIQVQRVISDILGIDFESYQTERIQLLGAGGLNLGVIAKVVAWSAEPALPTVDEVLATRAPEVAVESDIAAPTVDEASLIAGFAQAEDAALVQEPVAFIPGDEDHAEDDEIHFAEEDIQPVGRVSAAPILPDLTPVHGPEAEVLVPDTASAFDAFISEQDALEVEAGHESERIETGNYKLIAE